MVWDSNDYGGVGSVATDPAAFAAVFILFPDQGGVFLFLGQVSDGAGEEAGGDAGDPAVLPPGKEADKDNQRKGSQPVPDLKPGVVSIQLFDHIDAV